MFYKIIDIMMHTSRLKSFDIIHEPFKQMHFYGATWDDKYTI